MFRNPCSKKWPCPSGGQLIPHCHQFRRRVSSTNGDSVQTKKSKTIILLFSHKRNPCRLDDSNFQRYCESNVSFFSWRDLFFSGARGEKSSSPSVCCQWILPFWLPIFFFGWDYAHRARGGQLSLFQKEAGLVQLFTDLSVSWGQTVSTLNIFRWAWLDREYPAEMCWVSDFCECLQKVDSVSNSCRYLLISCLEN